MRFSVGPYAELAHTNRKYPLEKAEQWTQESGGLFLDLEDDSLDAVLVSGLNRISKPAGLILEIKRILKPGGEVWAEVPLASPWDQTSRQEDADYWRMTPAGLRVMMDQFDEIHCAAYIPAGCSLRSFSVFYGLKSAGEI